MSFKQNLIIFLKISKKILFNRYVLTIIIFLVWIIFFDNNSFLVMNELKKNAEKYENQLHYYKTEYEKNTSFYNKLMNNKEEKEKFARENYFMKRSNEEIFILVADTTNVVK